MRKFTEIASQALHTLNNSQFVKETGEKFNSYLDDINKSMETKSLSIDTLLDQLSVEIDKDMLSVANLEKMQPLGGEITITTNDKNSIKLNLKTYFNNSENKIILRESSKIIDNNILEASAIDKIQGSINPLKYEISPPVGS